MEIRLRSQATRPLSGRCLGREVAERTTKSREVDLSRLRGFHLRFAPKMRSGMTGNWSDDIWKFDGGNNRFSFRPKQSYVCAFLLHRKGKLNLFTLY